MFVIIVFACSQCNSLSQWFSNSMVEDWFVNFPFVVDWYFYKLQ